MPTRDYLNLYTGQHVTAKVTKETEGFLWLKYRQGTVKFNKRTGYAVDCKNLVLIDPKKVIHGLEVPDSALPK